MFKTGFKSLVLLPLLFLSLNSEAGDAIKKVSLQAKKDYSSVRSYIEVLRTFEEFSKQDIHKSDPDIQKDAKRAPEFYLLYDGKDLASFEDTSFFKMFCESTDTGWTDTKKSLLKLIKGSDKSPSIENHIDVLYGWKRELYETWFSKDSLFLASSIENLKKEKKHLDELLSDTKERSSVNINTAENESSKDSVWMWISISLLVLIITSAFLLWKKNNKSKETHSKLSDDYNKLLIDSRTLARDFDIIEKTNKKLENANKDLAENNNKFKETKAIEPIRPIRTVPPIVKTARYSTIYSGGPNGDLFVNERFSESFKPDESIYAITPINDTQASVKFIADNSIHYHVINYQDNDLLPVCKIKNTVVRDEENIRHDQDGLALKEGDNWRIKEKVIVEFI
jgi:hypothetical protein